MLMIKEIIYIMEKIGRIDLTGFNRTCNWTHLECGDEGFIFVTGYVPEAYKADVRILNKVNPYKLTYDDYFQVSYVDENGVHGFKSFKMYNDAELDSIEKAIPNLTYFHTTR